MQHSPENLSLLRCFEMSVDIYQSKQTYILEEFYLQFERCEDLQSLTSLLHINPYPANVYDRVSS
jgi:hypothetical protein